MKTIVNTTPEAIRQSKIEAIREFESFFSLTINDEKAINNDDAWLINTRKSCQCDCGETPAVEVILFSKKIGVSAEHQFTGYVGICEHCSE